MPSKLSGEYASEGDYLEGGGDDVVIFDVFVNVSLKALSVVESVEDRGDGASRDLVGLVRRVRRDRQVVQPSDRTER